MQHICENTTIDHVFYRLRNFEPSRGIYSLPRNFHVSAEFDKTTGD